MTEQKTETITNDESLMFSFGEPEIMNRDFTNYDYSELYYNDDGDYWEPPLDRAGLNKLTRANAYHGSILMARRNMIAGRYIQGGMQKQQMQSAVHDFLEFGDTALLKLRNYLGKVIGL